MAKASKLKTDLGDSTESVFSDEVIKIEKAINVNVALFPGLPVTMAVMGPKLTAYNDARLAPVYDSQGADTEAARTVVQKIITKNGNWLNDFCEGDVSLQKKTGYPFQREGEAQGVLPETTITVTTVPNSALIDFYITHVKGSGIHYGIMFTPSANLETNPVKWEFYYASQREGTIPDLERNTKYKMVSFALGTDKKLTYSEVVEITTL